MDTIKEDFWRLVEDDVVVVLSDDDDDEGEGSLSNFEDRTEALLDVAGPSEQLEEGAKGAGVADDSNNAEVETGLETFGDGG